VNDILKQRLVGALILVALGVVFWPIIFVEPGDRVEPGQASTPPRPAVDTSPIEPPQPERWRVSTETYDEEVEQDPALDDELLAGAEASSAVVLEPEQGAEAVADAEPAPADPPAAVQARTSAPEAPTLDANGVPVAWSLQVATVSSAAKAEELRQQLLSMQEKAYVRKLERGDKDLYRVFVGPKFERAQMEQTRARVDARFGVESLIVRYLP
jgi:DedD protein